VVARPLAQAKDPRKHREPPDDQMLFTLAGEVMKKQVPDLDGRGWTILA
jgi:hypothetical protein